MRPRSITGPLILIVIGTLFLLNNLHIDLEIPELFSRYWPVLLIVVGVIKLYERWSMPNLPRNGQM